MRTLSFLAVLILFLAPACGESHDGTPAEDAATDGSGGDSGGGTTDSGGGTTDSGGGTADGGGMSDGGGPTDGGLPTDGGVVVVDASPVDAGGPTDGGGAGTIDCGMMTCNAATEQCCLGGGPGGGTATCISIGDTCMGVASDCDGPEDCGAGQVCCASRDSSGGFGARCADSCGGGGTIGGGFELCHDAMDCSDRADMCCPLAFGGISGAYCGPMCFGTTP